MIFEGSRIEQPMVVEDWGLTPYAEAVTRQLNILKNFTADTLIFCSHPPVVTLGRGTKKGDLTSWTGEILETNRGGRATYHGPSQIVVYPIINLRHDRKYIQKRDLHSYMRALEMALVASLKEFDLRAEVRTIKPTEDSPSLTGVWVGLKKIASIGIAVKNWVTYHGLALNVEQDPTAFKGINPCGFSSDTMTSIEAALDKKINRQHVQNILREKLILYLS